MINIWGRRSAYNVQKALWTIGELNLPYEHVNIGGNVGGLDQADFLTMNPHGRIPVLVDGGFTIWESNSIVRYLCATYSKNHLWAELPTRRSLEIRNGVKSYIHTSGQHGAQPERDYNAVLFFQLSVPCPVSFTLGEKNVIS